MELQEFIRTHIQTVDQLRSILLLKANPDAHWESTDVAARTYLPPESAGMALKELEATGLVISHGEPPRYIYQPKTLEMRAHMDELVRLDRERPVTLLQIIYDRPGDLQAFRDAFRLRKKEE